MINLKKKKVLLVSDSNYRQEIEKKQSRCYFAADAMPS